jgi:hypothetical protein
MALGVGRWPGPATRPRAGRKHPATQRRPVGLLSRAVGAGAMSRPQGSGRTAAGRSERLIVPTSWNRAGKSACPPTRATATTPSSSGCLRDSRTVRGNSGSSSIRRTPRCASERECRLVLAETRLRVLGATCSLRRQDCDESRPQGGQAPDQASSGRQTGAAVPPGQIIPKAGGQSPDESQAAQRHTPGWRRPQTDPLAESHSPRGSGGMAGSGAFVLEVDRCQSLQSDGARQETLFVVAEESRAPVREPAIN